MGHRKATGKTRKPYSEARGEVEERFGGVQAYGMEEFENIKSAFSELECLTVKSISENLTELGYMGLDHGLIIEFTNGEKLAASWNHMEGHVKVYKGPFNGGKC